LLPAVESGLLTLIGATTENPHFEVNAPLLSRSTLFRLHPLGDDEVAELVRRGADLDGATLEPDAVDHLAQRAGGDGRHALTSTEVAVALASGRGAPIVVTLADAEAAVDAKAVRYGQDGHYDIISAFIKSIRGSDPDAALYWLARMLQAGEDPRFIARRLVVHASEDIGMADPQALLIATAAAQAVDFVGLPEARLNLAQATVHLATAPKSNRIINAINGAQRAANEAGAAEVPPHLRDGHYSAAASLGHAVGYQYPHSDPSGWVDQQYLPDELVGRRFYEPSPHGREGRLVQWWPGHVVD